jgi:hypothetical protein
MAFTRIDAMPYRRWPRPMNPWPLDSSPRNPSRVPSWRWDRAGHAVETATPLPTRSDPRTRRAYRYRKRYEARADWQDLIVLDWADPAVSRAHALHRGEPDDP